MEHSPLYENSAEPSAFYQIIKYQGCNLPDQYKGFIFAHWLRSLRYGNEYFKKIDKNAYYEVAKHDVEALLNHFSCIVQLAVLIDDKDVVLGFSCCRQEYLDYVYVQKEQRRQGIGKSLIPSYITGITALTKIGTMLWEQKYPHWKFNPYI